MMNVLNACWVNTLIPIPIARRVQLGGSDQSFHLTSSVQAHVWLDGMLTERVDRQIIHAQIRVPRVPIPWRVLAKRANVSRVQLVPFQA